MSRAVVDNIVQLNVNAERMTQTELTMALKNYREVFGSEAYLGRLKYAIRIHEEAQRLRQTEHPDAG